MASSELKRVSKKRMRSERCPSLCIHGDGKRLLSEEGRRIQGAKTGQKTAEKVKAEEKAKKLS